MKKFLLAIAVLFVSVSGSAIGLEKAGIANHLGVDINAGTNGIGFEVSTPVTRWVQARLGLSVMPGFSFTTSADIDSDYYGYGEYGNYMGDAQMDLTASFKRVQGSLIFNVYPFPSGSFYVALGAYFGGKDLIKITGSTDDPRFQDGQVSIGDYAIDIKDGQVKGGLKVNSFRPYVGIGWGRPVPNRRLNFGIELGVQLHGKPQVYTDYGDVDLSGIDGSDDFQKIMDNFKIWPVLKFTLSGRIF